MNKKKKSKLRRYPGGWGGLFNKKRFSWMEKEKNQWLKNLTMKEALKLEESLISSKFIWELRKNFFEDNPVCLKNSLMRKNVIR